MKFSTAVGSLLLSSVALAAPLSEENLARRESNRVARRARSHKQTHTNQRIDTIDAIKDLEVASAASSAEVYSSNWAGAVLIGSGYTSVTGSFVVPSVSVPSGGDSTQQYCAAAWVGIDGDTCGTAILQTGVNICIQNGQITNTAWYEWFPAAQEYWDSGITINTGDTVTATVTADGLTGGTATVTNESNGQSVSYTFSGTNAEWIMEDLSGGGGLLNFADFGSDFTISGATAISNGNTVDTTGATIMDISQNNQILTSTTASGSNVVISYQ
ncbi:aspergillopepsin-2 precursor, putative [Talaromyces stipitatus ATCC 10500]|uniref:Aspergillopepsin-2, putative n=1 Tax=Talaromyces stipitatus (strain ATCC 10500 / CBS 375.48 / QM 6759 / NRRL 1006) TaxID=441959 RepID=B8MG40_TALSN|nr:aspergillopepsin-2 precursor, putative [Talaromyces stipitatus ATCC 10500]EED15907.1 aspergillopepsin-2 precursor, putative [Talaromyces stipitatus ATCC 10500]